MFCTSLVAIAVPVALWMGWRYKLIPGTAAAPAPPPHPYVPLVQPRPDIFRPPRVFRWSMVYLENEWQQHQLVQQLASTPAPAEYRNLYEGDNPRGIVPALTRSDNYFIILGDWGRSERPGPCQRKVAEKMADYTREQARKGKTLLAVVTTGDNFYWSGVTPQTWQRSWGDVYNKPEYTYLKDVPWLGVLGNHDYGDNDPYLFCPDKKPKARSTVTVKTVAGGRVVQPYGGNAFNRDRNRERAPFTDQFHLPDYSYHYELNVHNVSLEFIMIDTNRDDVVYNLGPDADGFRNAFQRCGGEDHVKNFMNRTYIAGMQLLQERAYRGTAKTTVVLQHYPEKLYEVKATFEMYLNPNRTTNVLYAYGHVHRQECHAFDASGACTQLLSGSGGGCCAGDRRNPMVGGFTAVHLLDNGGFTTDFDSEAVKVHAWDCPY